MSSCDNSSAKNTLCALVCSCEPLHRLIHECFPAAFCISPIILPVFFLPLFVSAFDEHVRRSKTGGGNSWEMDFESFLDFVLALENKDTPEGLTYLWGFLTKADAHTLFRCLLLLTSDWFSFISSD